MNGVGSMSASANKVAPKWPGVQFGPIGIGSPDARSIGLARTWSSKPPMVLPPVTPPMTMAVVTGQWCLPPMALNWGAVPIRADHHCDLVCEEISGWGGSAVSSSISCERPSKTNHNAKIVPQWHHESPISCDKILIFNDGTPCEAGFKTLKCDLGRS